MVPSFCFTTFLPVLFFELACPMMSSASSAQYDAALLSCDPVIAVGARPRSLCAAPLLLERF